ncbi:MAG: peptidoglycan binding protein CsiV, partial [Proteobacteria bacterium]|nr:peptidoglycan binding protein CsiV [Pseudomonadota bacterium]
TQSPITLSITALRLIILMTCCAITSAVAAQQYLDLRQDGYIYDVDVVVFTRVLSQPTAESINNKALVKSEDVLVLPFWDRQQDLFQYPEVAEPPSDSVPIENQANPVRVLSDVILSTSMDHAIVNRLKVNPSFTPVYRQKWRQVPSAFLHPKYIEVSNLNQSQPIGGNKLNPSNFIVNETLPDYSIDGQVAFSRQRYSHLHVKMNLFRVNSEGDQIIYELSQQKRINLGRWQYFDHQQFGVLAKVTSIKLKKGE